MEIRITSRRCTTSDIKSLHAIHHTLSQRYPETQLEGCYLERQDVGRFEDTMPPHPYIHDGIVHTSGYHDINAVTWWMLKHHGIAVLGPPVECFALEVNLDDLLARMRHNLNTYRARFTTTPRRIAWLLGDDGVQWAVLGVLRQFYTFRERSITSKEGAGRYGLVHTPRQWHRLIQEAVNIRTGARDSLYHSRVLRAVEARAFLQLIIAACAVESTP